MLQKEFPFLKSYTLPSYNIKYTKSSKNLKFKLLLSIPSILLAVKKEKEITAKILAKENIVGIISDNRFGVYNAKIPSIYITHQLNVLSGNTTFITSKVHQKIIQKFTECWVPDNEDISNLSGKLGHLNNSKFPIKYVGVLSRFQNKEIAVKYNLLVLLSGPEPQRTLLEVKLINELKAFKGAVLFVRGVFDDANKLVMQNNFKVVNYLLSNQLEEVVNASDVVIARSGYSTIMDLAVLGKKAFFIPTPGQFEQEYLAKRLMENGIAAYTTQEKFKLNQLDKIDSFSGFKAGKSIFNLDFFKLF